MPISQIKQIPIGKLRPNPANVRTHPKKQIAALARLIDQIGFAVPVVADQQLIIQSGHARVEAGKTLGLRTVPVVILSGLSDAERRAYSLADNKLTELAGYDRPALAVELRGLAPLLEEAGLNIELTGFEPAEIDSIMGDLVDSEQDPLDEIPEVAKTAVSHRGDLWLLGQHRLFCGDATDAANVRKLMGRERAAMVFTDPPYGVRIASVQGRGKVRHREFLMGSGEMSREEHTRFLSDSLALAVKHSMNGSIHFVCTDWRHLGEMLAAGEEVYAELKNLIVWAKTNAGQGTFYRSQHELIFVFKNGDAPHTNNFGLGRQGRRRSNLWTYAGANTFGSGRQDLSMHPTVKPLALVADAMRDCSRRGDVVLDLFMGSGTAIMAAERVGRRAYGLEIDPLYVDLSVRRWQAYTKRDAVLQHTGRTFDEVTAVRAKRGGRHG
jgi:DNA modification methylase